MTFPHESIFLLGVSGRDEYNDPIAAPAGETEIPGCLVAPLQSTEPAVRGRYGVVVGWSVVLPSDAPAIAHDARVRVRDVVCAVEGEVADWGEPGAVLNVKRATG